MLSNDLRSLHILSKIRLSIPHLLGGGKILSVFCRGGRKFFDTTSAGKLHPPTHRKNGTSPTTGQTPKTDQLDRHCANKANVHSSLCHPEYNIKRMKTCRLIKAQMGAALPNYYHPSIQFSILCNLHIIIRTNYSIHA